MFAASDQHRVFYEGNRLVEALNQLVLRLIVCSMICGVLLSLVQEGHHSSLMRMLCSMFLGLILLESLSGERWNLNFDFTREAVEIGKSYAVEGSAMREQTQAQRITQLLESYILEKAKQYDTELEVQITLNEALLPERITLYGQTDPQTRQVLSAYISQELGIAKEHQLWTQ